MKLQTVFTRGLLVMIGMFAYFLSTAQSDDINKLVTTALNTANTQELVKYFNSMVDLGIPGSEDTYSKTQAKRIIDDFFIKNPVKSYKISKTGTSNDGSQFSIGKLEAGNKQFRVYYLVKKVFDKPLIHQFQIQEEK